jgi:hypothetical protein
MVGGNRKIGVLILKLRLVRLPLAANGRFGGDVSSWLVVATALLSHLGQGRSQILQEHESTTFVRDYTKPRATAFGL